MAKCGIGWKNPEPYYGYDLSLQGPGDDDKNDNAIEKVMKAA